jgi:ribosomal-protein-alanine N-acetyltransferase
MLKTENLILRQWTHDDFHDFVTICANKDVMEFYPRPLTFKESRNMGIKIQSLIHERGWGFWAVELKKNKKFIGFVGLHIPKDSLPFTPCVEIGWRLGKEFWGCGYATEAAKASLQYAFMELGLSEVVSFTALINRRSQAVMKKIGMFNTGINFKHPDIAADHRLSEHVLYKITKQQWQKYF